MKIIACLSGIIDVMDLLDFWAKTSPFQSVVTHGLISGTVAQILLTTYLSKGNREHLERTFSFNAEKLRSFMGYPIEIEGDVWLSEDKAFCLVDKNNQKWWCLITEDCEPQALPLVGSKIVAFGQVQPSTFITSESGLGMSVNTIRLRCYDVKTDYVSALAH